VKINRASLKHMLFPCDRWSVRKGPGVNGLAARVTSALSCSALITVGLMGIPASASHKYPAPPPDFFQTNSPSQNVVLAAGDVLNVSFFYNPELNRKVKVREDGKISLALFQGIQAAGETPEQLQSQLTTLYSKEYTKPEITVDLETIASSSVYITGEVLLPGAKEVHGKTTVAMVLAVSQVSQKTAGTKSVFLIRGTEEGKYRVYKLDASLPGGNARDIQVEPRDILFVPRKFIVKADDFMDQYVRELLPATPSASTTVLFTPGNPSIVDGAASSTH
jgi:protein involved in polysaccharide export with SLBB domain